MSASSYLPLLVGLVALLAGLAIGKAWERYKLRDGRWIDRRKARQSPHYIIGLNFLVSNQIDLAIEELSQAAGHDTEALEIHMILGNLYREKGQVGRAIHIHQGLLQRPRLTPAEHAHVLLCLGLDYRRGGFVDRALEVFKEVLRLEPQNRYALENLEKLHEEQHQWRDAYEIRQQLAAIDDAAGHPRTQAILAFLENELGLEASRAGDRGEAEKHFQTAVDHDARAVPAYLNLGDLYRTAGQTGAAIAQWERAVEVAPERAYLALERLRTGYSAEGAPQRFTELCRALVAANPQDWRARLALGRDLLNQGEAAAAMDWLLQALAHNPHAFIVHQAIWRGLADLNAPQALIDRYLALTREVIFYLDPHVCTRCRYRSTELLWQCPQCHEWNTFVEERLATARDEEASG